MWPVHHVSEQWDEEVGFIKENKEPLRERCGKHKKMSSTVFWSVEEDSEQRKGTHASSHLDIADNLVHSAQPSRLGCAGRSDFSEPCEWSRLPNFSSLLGLLCIQDQD